MAADQGATRGDGDALMRRSDVETFIRTRLAPTQPPLTPELRLYLASDYLEIWAASEETFAEMGIDPPFWAFAWPGGQALARWMLDRPEEVAGRRVLALGAGSGLEAIAAAKAGAATAIANDLDPAALVAAELNAQLNGVRLGLSLGDLLAPERLAPGGAPAADVVLAGDLFYTRDLATLALAALTAARDGGARILIGDPDRNYLPVDALERLHAYEVPTPQDLEDRPMWLTSIWTLA